MVYNRVGVVDLTPFAKLEVKGPDACEFMDRLCANHVPKASIPMLNKKIIQSKAKHPLANKSWDGIPKRKV